MCMEVRQEDSGPEVANRKHVYVSERLASLAKNLCQSLSPGVPCGDIIFTSHHHHANPVNQAIEIKLIKEYTRPDSRRVFGSIQKDTFRTRYPP